MIMHAWPWRDHFLAKTELEHVWISSKAPALMQRCTDHRSTRSTDCKHAIYNRTLAAAPFFKSRPMIFHLHCGARTPPPRVLFPFTGWRLWERAV